MERLSKAVAAKAKVAYTPIIARSEKVLQFGEGGFLRAFVDQMIDAANQKGVIDAGVVVVQPIEKGLCHMLDEQEGLYTLVLRGKEDGQVVRDKRIITAISRTVNPYSDYQAYLDCAKNPDLRFIVSNTTEAGIVYTGTDKFDDVPQASFPGKLTRLMYERFNAFGQEPGKGFILLPCELIDKNGDALKDAVMKTAKQWALGEAFLDWIDKSNIFTNTLVDRIVTGYPRDDAAQILAELGYEDTLLDAAEPFGLWVIEGPSAISAEWPLDKAGLPVIFTDNVTPYKLRKVRMLNGAHTSMVLAAYLAGKDTVGQCMEDPAIRAYMTRALNDEIMPMLQLPQDELKAFSDAIFERFENPFNRHYLLSIALNSVSKFKARVLPTLLEYQKAKGALPTVLTFSLAALLAFYRGSFVDGLYQGTRGDTRYPIADDLDVQNFFAAHSGDDAQALTHAALSQTGFWGEDLCAVPGLEAAVAKHLAGILSDGAMAAIKAL